MKSQKKGFTLIELIIVIAIIVILAAIVVITINPANLFANSRNSARSNDMGTFQTAIARYLADTNPNITAQRTLTDFTGYATLTGTSATGAYFGPTTTAGVGTASPAGTLGNCNGGASGTGLGTVTGAYLLSSTTVAGSMSIAVLLNNGYLSKLAVDPLNPAGALNYSVCIDTTIPSGSTSANVGKLVIFAPNAETVNGVKTIPYAVI